MGAYLFYMEMAKVRFLLGLLKYGGVEELEYSVGLNPMAHIETVEGSNPFAPTIKTSWGYGGIGRHARFRIWCQ